MKKQISLRIVMAGTALALLGGCAMFQESGQSALVGTWTNSLGTVWAIKADGTFDVDLKHHGRRDAWGTYTVQGDQATLEGLASKHHARLARMLDHERRPALAS